MEQSLQITMPTLKLSQKIRAYTKLHRYHLREGSFDAVRFGIGEIKAQIQELDNLTEKDVSGLAARIKRRKHATNDDMYRLSHAFLQEEKNIETFTKIPGAMQVLIKEFTGQNSERQLGSAECLCNLSLGQAAVCDKISGLAGSYLITYLHTAENQLLRMCLWTIANILATSLKGALTLMQMKLLPHLWKFYIHDKVADKFSDFREDSAVCLELIALKSDLLLRNDDREYILKHFIEKNPDSLAGEYHLQIIFHSLFSQPALVNSFMPSQLYYLINFSLRNISNTNEFTMNEQRLRILYSFRVLGNLIVCHSACYAKLLEQILTNMQTDLANILNAVFELQNKHLTGEVFWFLKNLLSIENPIGMSCKNIVEKLRIPKGYLSTVRKDT